MSIIELRDQIIKDFSDKWEINDKAHRQNHFEAVFQCALRISKDLELEYDPKLMLFVAYFHDMFAWSRVNHHELSWHWMMSTDHPLILKNLSASETTMVAWACHQHRASFKGKFKGPFSELMNSADRELPGNVQQMLDRAVKFREKLHPEMSEDERMAGAIEHLKEKFGAGGYARYPEMYLKVFGGELEQQRLDIANL